MYSSFFLFLAVAATINGKFASTFLLPNERIVGGQNAAIEDFPYQVSIVHRLWNWSHYCGGSIISSRIVISAAHCFGNADSDYAVRYGTTEVNRGRIVNVKRIHRHEAGVQSDVAVVHLAGNIVFGRNARPIALASTSPAPGTHAVVTGWGRTTAGTSPSILQKVGLQIVDQAVCNRQWGGQITDKMLCAGFGGMNSCSGDSGGPLVANNQLVGIVSWGTRSCLDPKFSAVYADVAKLRPWIDDKIRRN